MTTQRVKLKHIAEKANISINSVSKALKDSPSISQKTKEKVRKIADELGYIPNAHAQTLRAGSLDVIAVVYDNLTNPYYSTMSSILTEEFKKDNIESMFFVEHHENGYLSDTLAKRIISYRVSGIISFLEPTDSAATIVKQNKIPLVLLGRNGWKTQTTSIYSDDIEGGKIAARTLINLNGKSFVYVTKHAELEICRNRLAGFKLGLEENNYILDDSHIIIGNAQTSAESKLIELLNNNPTVDSIFCFSDLIALEIKHLLQELNFENINIIGYDNLQGYLPYPVKISSIDGGKKEMAQLSIKILTEQMTQGYNETPKYLKIDVFYQEGQTTKPNKKEL